MRHKYTRRPARGLAPWVALAATLVGGCATNPFAGRPAPAPAPAIDRSALAAAALNRDFALLEQLLASNPVEQQEMVDAANAAYSATPTPTRKLRLALLLGTPGHPGSDLPFARQLLNELLVDPHPQLLPAERTLVRLEVQQIGDYLTLKAENRTLRAQADRASDLALENRRLEAAADENARLRRALQEARAKLAAIANIEKSLNERKPEGRPK